MNLDVGVCGGMNFASCYIRLIPLLGMNTKNNVGTGSFKETSRPSRV
jgi:hypothetical protein